MASRFQIRTDRNEGHAGEESQPAPMIVIGDMVPATPTPAKDKLDVIMSSRFRAVVDETLEQLELLGVIATELEQNSQAFDALDVGVDMTDILGAEKELEKQFDDLMTQRAALRGVSHKKKFLENQKHLSDITEALQRAKQAIHSTLEQEQIKVADAYKVQRDRAELEEILNKTFDELDSGTFAFLEKQVEMRDGKQRLLIEKKEHQLELSKELAILEKTLDEEAKEFNSKLTHKKERIRLLREQLRGFNGNSKTRTGYEVATEESHVTTSDRLRARRLDDLRKEIAQLEKALEDDAFVNMRTSDFLNRNKEMLDKELAQWESKYQTEYPALCTQLDELKAVQEKDFEELLRLRKRWADEEALKADILKAERNAKEAEKQRQRIAKLFYHAQTVIRFYWRCYRRRQLAAKAKKPKKAAKKGKGKKK